MGIKSIRLCGIMERHCETFVKNKVYIYNNK